MRLLTKLTYGRFVAKLDGMFSANRSGKLGCSDVILVVCVIFFLSFHLQLEFLEEMYSEILNSKDVESKDSKKSSNKFSQRAAAMQGGCPHSCNSSN